MTPIGFIAFFVLAIEVIVLILLLTPYVNRFTAPLIEKCLVRFRNGVWIYMIFLLLALANSTINMFSLQTRAEEARGTFDRPTALAQKFKEERNFYLYLFSVTLWAIIIRLGPILNEYRTLLDKKDQKKEK